MRVNFDEGVKILKNYDLLELGKIADEIRRKKFGDVTTFIIDRNINYTNICENECKFCAFWRKKNNPSAYVLSNEEILEKVRETVDAGGTQVMIQGGLNPVITKKC